MRLVRTLFGRSGVVGLVSDLVMVVAAGLRLTRRTPAGSPRQRDPGELLLVTAAGWRLLRRLRRRRRARRDRRLAPTE